MKLKSAVSSVVDTMGNVLLAPPYGGFGYYYNHGSRNHRRIALTFDDGPNEPSTLNLLDALEKLNVPATFFCVGMQAQIHPQILRRIYTDGHVVGNHSMFHSRKDGLLFNNVKHIDESTQAIADIIGHRPQLYRPPWGWLTPWEGHRLHQRGYNIIGWDVYTLDWKIPEIDGRILAAGICRDVKPGSIILLHDASGMVPKSHKIEMTRAVEQLVPRLRAEGYEFVTVPELLQIPAYTTFRIAEYSILALEAAQEITRFLYTQPFT